MNEIVQVISQVGFPIVVAMYSLIRLEKTVQENTLVMTKIAEKLDVAIPTVQEVKGGNTDGK